VTAWWKEAQDRDSWKAVIKEAKANKELVVLEREKRETRIQLGQK
jgi:hypothetical protein